MSKEGKPKAEVAPIEQSIPEGTATTRVNQATIESSFTEENVFKFLSGEIGSDQLLGFTDEDAHGFAKFAYDFYENGRYVDAARVFANLVTMKPENAYFQAMWGACLQMLDEPDKALRAYSTAIELDGNNVQARVNRADLLLAKAKFNEALDDLEFVVKADPQAKNPATQRARALANATAEALRVVADLLAKKKL